MHSMRSEREVEVALNAHPSPCAVDVPICLDLAFVKPHRARAVDEGLACNQCGAERHLRGDSEREVSVLHPVS